MHRLRSALTVLLVCGALLTACGDDGDDTTPTTTAAAEATTTTAPVDDTTSTASPGTAEATTTTVAETTTTTAPAPPLTVLVTNDDGVGAPGIDAVVELLTTRDDVEVVVVAPDGNRSGSSDSTSEEPVTASDATTASGHPATAVSGFPADAVQYALDTMGIVPDLVISGINDGANIGPFVELSGTVGAARTAARAGYPALAVSQGIGEPADFPAAVPFVASWLDDHLDELRAGAAPFVDSINVPTCGTGEVRGLVEVTVATDFGDRSAVESDCTSTATDPADDVDALNIGFAALADVGF